MDPPTGAAQEHYIATLAFHRKVFVEGADHRLFGQCYDRI